MGINAYDQYYNPIQPKPLDFGFLLQAQAYKDQKAAKAAELYESALKPLREVKALPVERDINTRNERVKYHENNIMSWYDNYSSGNDSQAAFRKLADIKNEIQSDLQYGVLGNIHGKALQYEKLLVDFQKADSEGKFKGLSDVARYVALQKPLKDYEQSGAWQELAPGMYNQVGWGNISEYQDVAEKLDKYAQQWSSDQRVTKKYGQLRKDNYGYLSSITGKYVDPNEVIQGALTYAMSDPSLKRQFNDMQTYYTDAYGQQGAQILINQLTGIAGAMGAREGYLQEDKSFLQDWMMKFGMEEAAKKAEKLPGPNIGYMYPSVPSPSNDYWANKSLNLEKITAPTQKIYTPSLKDNTIGISRYKNGNNVPVLNEEQKVDLQKAEKLFGRVSSSFNGQKELLSKYYNYMGNKMINFERLLPEDLEEANKKADQVNMFYFGNRDNTKGANIAGTTLFKVVGDNVTESNGSELRTAYPEHTFKWEGALPSDNPYYAQGHVFSILDDKGAVVNTIVAKSPHADNPINQVGWLMYQSKNGEDVKLPKIAGKELIVSYQHSYDSQELDNSGNPIPTPENDKVLIKDKHGNIVIESLTAGEVGDPIADAYQKLSIYLTK